MTIAVREAEALGLLDSAIEQLEQAVRAVRSADARLAGQVRTAARRNRAAAHQLYASALALLGDGPPPASEVQRTAALLHVAGRIRHIHAEVAAIADVTGGTGESPDHPHETVDALGLMAHVTLARLRRAREAYAEYKSEPAGELMGTAPGPGVTGAPVLAGSAVVCARCLERIQDDAGEIAEQVVVVSSGLFRELADTPWPGEPPALSAVSAG